jgi:hypothetical protein
MPPHPFRSSKVAKINPVTPKRAAHTWDSENKKNKKKRHMRCTKRELVKVFGARPRLRL